MYSWRIHAKHAPPQPPEGWQHQAGGHHTKSTLRSAHPSQHCSPAPGRTLRQAPGTRQQPGGSQSTASESAHAGEHSTFGHQNTRLAGRFDQFASIRPAHASACSKQFDQHCSPANAHTHIRIARSRQPPVQVCTRERTL